MGVREAKDRARREARARRAAVPREELAWASEAVSAHLAEWTAQRRAAVVSAFWPLVLRGELDIRPLLAELTGSGRRVALPCVVGTAPPRMEHRLFRGAGDLVEGAFGTREPPVVAPGVLPSTVEVAIVPALAISADGARLGYGGGFYDAFLATTAALRVGVALELSAPGTIPTEPHDARLDAVVTPAGVAVCR